MRRRAAGPACPEPQNRPDYTWARSPSKTALTSTPASALRLNTRCTVLITRSRPVMRTQVPGGSQIRLRREIAEEFLQVTAGDKPASADLDEGQAAAAHPPPRRTGQPLPQGSGQSAPASNGHMKRPVNLRWDSNFLLV